MRLLLNLQRRRICMAACWPQVDISWLCCWCGAGDTERKEKGKEMKENTDRKTPPSCYRDDRDVSRQKPQHWSPLCRWTCPEEQGSPDVHLHPHSATIIFHTPSRGDVVECTQSMSARLAHFSAAAVYTSEDSRSIREMAAECKPHHYCRPMPAHRSSCSIASAGLPTH
ncbi:hypothetical protein BKA80DRAFT_93103 [Phyllosticta citrichinensis]